MTATMSRTRIDHKGHDHPLTPAAREICRKAMRNGAGPAKIKKGKKGKAKIVVTKPAKVKKSSKVIVERVEDDGTDEALAKNRSRFTDTPVPTDDEREAALADVTIKVGSTKGSKVVHALTVADDTMLTCTKKLTTAAPVDGTRADVTCKNCMKALNITAS